MASEDRARPAPGFPFRVCCSSVAYRKGWIEVMPGVHVSSVNLETWEVSSEWSSPLTSVDAVPEEAIVANAELELTPGEARALADALLRAADDVDLASGGPTSS